MDDGCRKVVGLSVRRKEMVWYVDELTFSGEHHRQLALRLRWHRCKAGDAPVFPVAEHDVARCHVCIIMSASAPF